MNIHIPTPLRTYTGGLETVSVPGATVNAVFHQLTVNYPELKQHLFTQEGKLRSFVNVYLNDDDIRYLDAQQETAVKDNDELTIIPSIAGGCCTCCPLNFPTEDVIPIRAGQMFSAKGAALY